MASKTENRFEASFQ